ncbi:hypothetical protein ACHAWF_002166 [Thalassiosira exigua]
MMRNRERGRERDAAARVLLFERRNRVRRKTLASKDLSGRVRWLASSAAAARSDSCDGSWLGGGGSGGHGEARGGLGMRGEGIDGLDRPDGDDDRRRPRARGARGLGRRSVGRGAERRQFAARSG